MTAACLAVTRLYNQFRLQNVRARLLLVAIIILLAPAQSEAVQYREVEWTELMPKEDLAALLDPPDFLNGIEDGSQQDSVSALNQREITDQKAKRYREALSSTQPIAEFDQQAIRIPGYIVPLAQNEERRVTSFFIVPYFCGAFQFFLKLLAVLDAVKQRLQLYQSFLMTMNTKILNYIYLSMVLIYI